MKKPKKTPKNPGNLLIIGHLSKEKCWVHPTQFILKNSCKGWISRDPRRPHMTISCQIICLPDRIQSVNPFAAFDRRSAQIWNAFAHESDQGGLPSNHL